MDILWVFAVEAGMRRREPRGDQGRSVPGGSSRWKSPEAGVEEGSAGSQATARSEGFVLLFLQAQDFGGTSQEGALTRFTFQATFILRTHPSAVPAFTEQGRRSERAACRPALLLRGFLLDSCLKARSALFSPGGDSPLGASETNLNQGEGLAFLRPLQQCLVPPEYTGSRPHPEAPLQGTAS